MRKLLQIDHLRLGEEGLDEVNIELAVLVSVLNRQLCSALSLHSSHKLANRYSCATIPRPRDLPHSRINKQTHRPGRQTESLENENDKEHHGPGRRRGMSRCCSVRCPQLQTEADQHLPAGLISRCRWFDPDVTSLATKAGSTAQLERVEPQSQGCVLVDRDTTREASRAALQRHTSGTCTASADDGQPHQDFLIFGTQAHPHRALHRALHIALRHALHRAVVAAEFLLHATDESFGGRRGKNPWRASACPWTVVAPGRAVPSATSAVTTPPRGRGEPDQLLATRSATERVCCSCWSGLPPGTTTNIKSKGDEMPDILPRPA